LKKSSRVNYCIIIDVVIVPINAKCTQWNIINWDVKIRLLIKEKTSPEKKCIYGAQLEAKSENGEQIAVGISAWGGIRTSSPKHNTKYFRDIEILILSTAMLERTLSAECLWNASVQKPARATTDFTPLHLLLD